MCEIDWSLVDNAAILIDAMGDAPCFHDAEVIDSNQAGEAIEVTTHIFRGTREVDARGYYKLEKHHLVTFRMLGIQESTLPKPYQGDTLSGLDVRREDGLLRIEFASVIDPQFGGYVRCRSAAVTKVVPCDSGGQAFP